MATKDRTSLKNDFANGKYATGEKFADLIDSMKVVQLPVVDPQALGTSLSFIDSISQDADGKITATKKTLDLANAHELNPFKGWYKTGDTLPTDGFDGAYLYFKDTSELTGQTTIYRWNGTTYADTGTVVDTSNVQTFGSGQAVNDVKIKDENGEEVSGTADVFSAEAGKMLNDKIFGVTPPSAINQISGLSNGIPNQGFLQNAEPSVLRYGVLNEVDTVSPFRDILGHSIKLTPHPRSYFYNTLTTSEYPQEIHYSFWVKGDEVNLNDWFDICWGFMDTDYNYISKFLDLKTIVNTGVGYNNTYTETRTNFTVDRHVRCVYSIDGWYQIVIDDNITWNESKKPWSFGLRLSADSGALPFTIVNPQISYTELPIGVFVIQDVDNSVSPYPTNDSLSKKIDDINEKIDEVMPPSKPNQLHLTFAEDADSYILSPFNDTCDIKLTFKLKRAISAGHNRCFNFQTVVLVNKTTNAETNVHQCSDDICPSNFNGTYLGGNHGNSKIRKLTITNHGLTYSNIGEVWTYGTNGEATILGILDADNIIAAGKNTSVYPKFSFPVINANEVLSHNGSSLTVSASEYYQWFSSTNQPEITVLADGEVITEDGDYYFNTLKICEAYDIMNTASQISIIQDNVGTYTSTPNPTDLEGADKVARHSIIYQFDSANQWFIATTFTAYQDIDLTRFGYTQQVALGTNSVHLYIPKALPIVDGNNTTFDFRTAPSYASHTGVLYLTSDYWENPNLPPDRWLTYNDNIALHSGFLYDYGVGGNNRKDCVNNTFYLPDQNKIYINGIDNKLTINAGDSYSGINWRTYIDRTKVMTNGVISLNLVEYDDKLYIYADFNQTGIYEITIPDSYLGKTIEVFEKSDNITLLTPISNRKVLIKVDTANPMYGYIVAQIKR